MWLLDTDRFVHDANAAARAELLRGRLLVQRGAHLLGATSLLDLTPAQARVATGLAQGRTLEQMAAASGTRVVTVRSHLASVMQRVGARRSDDLVRRLHDGHQVWGASQPAPP